MKVTTVRRGLHTANVALVLCTISYALFFFVLDGPVRAGPRPPESILGDLPEAQPRTTGGGPGPAELYRPCRELEVGGALPVFDPGENDPGASGDDLTAQYVLGWMKIDESRRFETYVHLSRITDGETVSIRVGQRLDGVWKLTSVTEREAVFENVESGQEATLRHQRAVVAVPPLTAHSPPDTMPKRIGELPPVDETRPPIEPVRIREGLYELPREEKEWLGRHGERALDQVALVPERDPKTARPNGLRIRTIDKGAALAGHGLLPGDKLVKIDDHPVTSRADVIGYLKRAGPDRTRYVLTIERKGRLLEITYQVK